MEWIYGGSLAHIVDTVLVDSITKSTMMSLVHIDRYHYEKPIFP